MPQDHSRSLIHHLYIWVACSWNWCLQYLEGSLFVTLSNHRWLPLIKHQHSVFILFNISADQKSWNSFFIWLLIDDHSKFPPTLMVTPLSLASPHLQSLDDRELQAPSLNLLFLIFSAYIYFPYMLTTYKYSPPAQNSLQIHTSTAFSKSPLGYLTDISMYANTSFWFFSINLLLPDFPT